MAALWAGHSVKSKTCLVRAKDVPKEEDLVPQMTATWANTWVVMAPLKVVMTGPKGVDLAQSSALWEPEYSASVRERHLLGR
jgi:hypothetical protein